MVGRVVDALASLYIIARLGKEYVRDEALRIAVIEREPTRLDLYHDPMPGQEHMIGMR
jgi:hypothetical protein